jgi:hypothetical protein
MRPDGGEALDERVEELVLLKNGVRPGLDDRLVQLVVGIAGQRDQAEVGMVLAKAGDSGHAVDERHVQVDDDRVRRQVVGELDRVQAVRRVADDGELRLMLDQR